MIEVLGYIGAILISLAYLPQAIKTVKTRNVEGLSLNMFMILLVAQIIWIMYGILIQNTPTIVCNSITFIETSVIFFFIVKKNQTIKI